MYIVGIRSELQNAIDWESIYDKALADVGKLEYPTVGDALQTEAAKSCSHTRMLVDDARLPDEQYQRVLVQVRTAQKRSRAEQAQAEAERMIT